MKYRKARLDQHVIENQVKSVEDVKESEAK
jgi:hypothetical protein